MHRNTRRGETRQRILRWYEPPLLALCAALLAAIVVMWPAAGQSPFGQSPPGGGAAADETEPGSGHIRETPAETPAEAPAEGRPVSEASAREARPEDAEDLRRMPVCVPQEEALTLWTREAAVQAERAGRFAFYGTPDPRTGSPTDDSYSLLVGCFPELQYLNRPALRFSGGSTDPKGGSPRGSPAEETWGEALREPSLSTVAEPLSRAGEGGDALTVLHAFDGGVLLRQDLALEGGQSPLGGLRITYRLTNEGAAARTVDLRSVLVPPAFSEPNPPFVLVGRSAEPGIAVTEGAVVDGTIPPVLVPRRSAVSDSTGLWRPGPTGPPPDRLALGGHMDFALAFDGPETLGEPMGPVPSLGAYWDDVALEPGATRAFSVVYEPSSAPDAGSGREAAP